MSIFSWLKNLNKSTYLKRIRREPPIEPLVRANARRDWPWLWVSDRPNLDSRRLLNWILLSSRPSAKKFTRSRRNIWVYPNLLTALKIKMRCPSALIDDPHPSLDRFYLHSRVNTVIRVVSSTELDWKACMGLRDFLSIFPKMADGGWLLSLGRTRAGNFNTLCKPFRPTANSV